VMHLLCSRAVMHLLCSRVFPSYLWAIPSGSSPILTIGTQSHRLRRNPLASTANLLEFGRPVRWRGGCGSSA
jgi:hypothetical protein